MKINWRNSNVLGLAPLLIAHIAFAPPLTNYIRENPKELILVQLNKLLEANPKWHADAQKGLPPFPESVLRVSVTDEAGANVLQFDYEHVPRSETENIFNVRSQNPDAAVPLLKETLIGARRLLTQQPGYPYVAADNEYLDSPTVDKQLEQPLAFFLKQGRLQRVEVVGGEFRLSGIPSQIGSAPEIIPGDPESSKAHLESVAGAEPMEPTKNYLFLVKKNGRVLLSPDRAKLEVRDPVTQRVFSINDFTTSTSYAFNAALVPDDITQFSLERNAAAKEFVAAYTQFQKFRENPAAGENCEMLSAFQTSSPALALHR